MNWDRVRGNWKQLKGTVQLGWGKLTDDHLTAAAGRREICAGRLQEAYGIGKEKARRLAGATVTTIREVANDDDETDCFESTHGNDSLPYL
jgi:uncharacterized protein YjbJ (UPF0337 family)